jgi:hypothetical protein
MAVVHPGASLVPHFRDFLPAWAGQQPWYRGVGVPRLRPIGFLRLEDPAGEVGMETHLVTDGAATYQIPLTYRGAPLAGAGLVATAQHSVLGRRWVYDGVTDPVWHSAMVRLVRTEGASEPAGRSGMGPAEARGLLLGPAERLDGPVAVDLDRVLVADQQAGCTPSDPDVIGMVRGRWYPDGPGGTAAEARLARLRTARPGPPGRRTE